MTVSGVKKMLTEKRGFLNGSILEYLIVAVVFLAATISAMNFIPINGIDSKVFTQGPGDATSGFLWLNYADPSLRWSLIIRTM